MEKIITDANISELEATGLPIVIDFSATWCGPARKLLLSLKNLLQNMKGRVIIGKCDVDDNDELTSKYGIRNVPTVLFIKDGNVIDKNVGAAPKSDFVEKVEALLK